MVLLPALILDAFYSGTMPRDDQARQCLPPTKCLFLTPLRAEVEYRALLVKAGLRRTRVIRTPSASAIIEADPA
jgi:hypothetical protein